METEKFEVKMGGDILEIQWTGSVWQYRAKQTANRSEAMAYALVEYLQASGEDVPEVYDIDDYDEFLSQYGNWIEDEE